MRTAQQRIAQYNARMDAAAIAATLTAVESLAEANYQSYANTWVPLSQQVKDILDVAGVSTALYFGYQGFANSIYRATLTCSGESLSQEAWAVMAKFVGMGLAQSVCESIISVVFTVVPPGSGPFATCGPAAVTPDPADAATAVPVDGTLSWFASPAMTGCDVYLDIVSPPVVKVVDNVKTWHYDYSGLAAATPHFWRVDIHFGGGSPCIVTGTEWGFTTA